MVIQIPQLPTEIWSDEPPLESDLHREQIELLLACLKLWWQDRSDFYASGNLTIDFNPAQIKSRDFRGPDFFLVLDTDPKPRKSWVVWAEQGKYPNLIVEILSDSTADVDRTFKKKLYQDTFRTPEYFWFDLQTLEFQGFCLMRGQHEPITPNQDGWLWSQQLDLFLGVQNTKLRYFTADGQLLPDPKERGDRLAAKLRELGIDPDQV
ncbi:MAG: Uma2 family endonuclease [Thermosynechococcaceae cyanobacterium]